MIELALVVVLVLALGIAGFQFYYFKKRFEETENEIKKLRAVLNKISFDLTLDKILDASSSETMRKKLIDLGDRIFEFLKRKYNIKGVTTYMEMKKRIEELDSIPEDEKEDVIEFLENMIYIEYSSKPIPPRRKEKIKKNIITMLRKMGTSG